MRGFGRFVAFVLRNVGISRGFILIQDGGDHSRKDLWVHFGTFERTRKCGICGIRFIVIQINISINLGMDLRRQTL